jgi:hypothetical protein
MMPGPAVTVAPPRLAALNGLANATATHGALHAANPTEHVAHGLTHVGRARI